MVKTDAFFSRQAMRSWPIPLQKVSPVIHLSFEIHSRTIGATSGVVGGHHGTARDTLKTTLGYEGAAWDKLGAEGERSGVSMAT